MAVTGAKFEAYYKIRKNISLYVKKGQKLEDDSIIRIALEQYDVNITKKDLEEMKRDYTRYMFFYKMLL